MYLKCPKCGENGFERVGRKWWMRFIPQSRLFSCYLCNYSSIQVSERQPGTEAIESTIDTDDLHVRASGVTYGPASLQDVQSWAAAGRLQGDHTISSDGLHWRPAKTISELGLTWEIAPAGKLGTYILSPTAVRELANEDAIPADTTVTDLTTGKTLPLSKAIEPETSRSNQ